MLSFLDCFSKSLQFKSAKKNKTNNNTTIDALTECYFYGFNYYWCFGFTLDEKDTYNTHIPRKCSWSPTQLGIQDVCESSSSYISSSWAIIYSDWYLRRL